MGSMYYSPAASVFESSPDFSLEDIQNFHSSLPDFHETPLVDLQQLAESLGVKRVLLKNESSRCGLPAFKILGASWAIHVALCKLFHLPSSSSFDEVRTAVNKKRVPSSLQRGWTSICLFAATDGNHGRAVARIASLLGIRAMIYVPEYLDELTCNRISSESSDVEVIRVRGEYDVAVAAASSASGYISDIQRILIQDTALEGYTSTPQHIVNGYSTMFTEVDAQISPSIGHEPLQITHVITPVGVGSLAQAVVSHYKSPKFSSPKPCVVTVEPTGAACLRVSLEAKTALSVTTGQTIMEGMNCGTVSPLAWPLLKEGVDVSLTVSDEEADQAIKELQDAGHVVGPCGAATLAALRKLRHEASDSKRIMLDNNAVVLLLCTEGARPYNIGNQGSRS